MVRRERRVWSREVAAQGAAVRRRPGRRGTTARPTRRRPPGRPGRRRWPERPPSAAAEAIEVPGHAGPRYPSPDPSASWTPLTAVACTSRRGGPTARPGQAAASDGRAGGPSRGAPALCSTVAGAQLDRPPGAASSSAVDGVGPRATMRRASRPRATSTSSASGPAAPSAPAGLVPAERPAGRARGRPGRCVRSSAVDRASSRPGVALDHHHDVGEAGDEAVAGREAPRLGPGAQRVLVYEGAGGATAVPQVGVAAGRRRRGRCRPPHRRTPPAASAPVAAPSMPRARPDTTPPRSARPAPSSAATDRPAHVQRCADDGRRRPASGDRVALENSTAGGSGSSARARREAGSPAATCDAGGVVGLPGAATSVAWRAATDGRTAGGAVAPRWGRGGPGRRDPAGLSGRPAGEDGAEPGRAHAGQAGEGAVPGRAVTAAAVGPVRWPPRSRRRPQDSGSALERQGEGDVLLAERAVVRPARSARVRATRRTRSPRALSTPRRSGGPRAAAPPAGRAEPRRRARWPGGRRWRPRPAPPAGGRPTSSGHRGSARRARRRGGGRRRAGPRRGAGRTGRGADPRGAVVAGPGRRRCSGSRPALAARARVHGRDEEEAGRVLTAARARLTRTTPSSSGWRRASERRRGTRRARRGRARLRGS